MDTLIFKVDPAAYKGVFVTPADIVDRYLKLAPGGFIKVLLYVCRHCATPVSNEDIASHTGLSLSEVTDACLYWQQENLLLPADKAPLLTVTEETEEAAKNSVSAAPTVTLSEETPTPKKDYAPVRHQLPTYSDVCTRIGESAEVRELLGSAQERLCRTVGKNDLAHLLDLYDYYGLPAAVIMAICEYACANGKGSNMNYVYTVGKDWSRRGIDTLEAADEEFKKLESLNTVWVQFCKAAHIRRESPTEAEKKYIDIWTLEWHFSVDVLLMAYEEMTRYAEKAGFKYMHKILANWHENGITTPEQAQAFQREFREKQDEALAKKARRGGMSPNAAKQAPASAPSYDIDKATHLANTGVPELKKKH